MNTQQSSHDRDVPRDYLSKVAQGATAPQIAEWIGRKMWALYGGLLP